MAAQVVPEGGITTPKGFKALGIRAGLKASGKLDLAIVRSETQASAAGVFTKSVVAAPPVVVCREFLRKTGGKAHAIVINSGQANACTGDQGRRDAEEIASVVAKEIGVQAEDVLVCSTGVVGIRIDVDKVRAAITNAVQEASSSGSLKAAQAIMTTDLVPKTIAMKSTEFNFSVGGMAKGSGMIHPDMATMLSYVTTDAAISPSLWRDMITDAANRSFNQITVDGDTSTNDTLIGLANGCSGIEVVAGTKEYDELRAMLLGCCIQLAKSIARDGEGATVLVEIRVSGASSDSDARRVARSVASSNLFKAAVYGRDPNWGRIAVAAGYAGVPFDPSQLDIVLGPHELMRRGTPLQFDKAKASAYIKDAAAAAYLTDDNKVLVDIRVGTGPGSGLAWGCDLSYE